MTELLHELWVDPATPARSFLVRAPFMRQAVDVVPVKVDDAYEPGSAWKCYHIDVEGSGMGFEVWRVNCWFRSPAPHKPMRPMNLLEKLLVCAGWRDPMPSICSSQRAMG